MVVYGVLTQQQVDDIDETEKAHVSNFEFRYKMHVYANNLLDHYCKKHDIIFINMENELLNKDKSLKAKFYSSKNIYNLHLLWEPLIALILSKIKYCKIPLTFKEDIHDTLVEYLNKPKFYNKSV